jgi:ADP-ribose pyrophosphatase YjhB (NUDIX family)
VARIDYFNDPNAPKANSIVPSVTAIVPNERGELLLVHKTDNDLWALPGGAMDVGESMADTVVREVKEETGIEVEVTGVVGIYTNPNHVMAYDDGEVRQQCSICFTARMLGGQLATSDETSEVAFVAPEGLGGAPHPSLHAAADRPLPGATEHALHRLSQPALQPLLGSVDGGLEQRPGPNNGPVHRVILRVAVPDLADALVQGHGLASRPDGHVGEGERVHDWAVLDREGGQLLDQAAFFGLEPRSGVVGDQRGQPLPALSTQEPGAVDWMKAEPVQRRGIADAMQERRGHECLAVVGSQDDGHGMRLPGDGLDVQPSIAHRRQQPLSLRCCPLFQGHGATIARLLDRAEPVLSAA